MSDILLNILYFAIVFWIGWRVRTAVIMYHLSEDPDRMIKILNQIKEINTRPKAEELKSTGDVKIEYHNGHVYLFENETDRFLAQGSTVAEAIEIMDKRFPGRFALKVVIPDSHSA